MKRHLAKSVCFVGLLALAVPGLGIAADEAADEANPFKHIVERNVFALKPPPPPPDPNDVPPPPPAPLAKVVLTGILNVLGPPRAMLEVVEQQAGKQPATPSRPILREGERDGTIEVLSIDVEKNLVRIKNGNVETNLTFDVQKQGATTMVAAPAPAPALPVLQPRPTTVPAAGTAEAETGGRRGVVVAGANQTATAANNAAAPVPQLQMPSRQIRSPQMLQQQQQGTTTDPVAQWVQLKAQEERARQQRAAFPPPPPAPGADNNTPQQNPYPPPPVPQ